MSLSLSLFPVSFLLLPALLISPSLAQKDNSPNCSCYLTSGDSSSYFTYHRFYDFRNIPSIPLNTFLEPPPNITAQQGNGTEPPTSAFFTTAPFTKDWAAQNWVKDVSNTTPVAMANSLQNLFILRDNPTAPTHLTLRTTRQPTFQSAAEIESAITDIYYASIRIRTRIAGDPGAVAGLFTYSDDNNESDIEILTRDDGSVFRATNQPTVDPAGNDVPGASTVERVAGWGGKTNSSWTEWVEWRLDWVDGRSVWSVDGVNVAEKTYGVPKVGSHFVLNMWGNGGGWSGDMSVGGMAEMDVEWVQMVYNTSGMVANKDGKACGVICQVDGVKNVGFPEILRNASASVAWVGHRAFGWLEVIWIMVLGVTVVVGL